jgi:pimeloyl-ACP methyl ester carboxylesterase
MIAVTRYFWAAGIVLAATALAAAGDSPGVTINSGRTSALLPGEKLADYDWCSLESRRPYERGKVPVVLVHGLWGSPRNWDRMVADLDADRSLRRHFQFWAVRYASGDSIVYSAHVLRQSLRRARQVLDPDGTDAAFDRMVVVGHSLGGVLAKMLGQSGGPRLWQSVCARPIEQVIGPSEECALVRHSFFYKAVPEVSRVIFIATPHRGSPLASGRLQELDSQLRRRVDPLSQAYAELLSANDPGIFIGASRDRLFSSVGELAPGHPLLLTVSDLGDRESIRSHSIIADFRNPPRPGGTDGIVPYSSSHLDGVDSELVVHGSHFCVNDPRVVAEVRRVLIEHCRSEPARETDDQSCARCKSAAPRAGASRTKSSPIAATTIVSPSSSFPGASPCHHQAKSTRN